MTVAPPRLAYIFDIDGTCSDHSHRLHLIHADREGGKDWPSFHAGCLLDTPIEAMCALARTLREHTPWQAVFFITGRMEAQRAVTTQWLRSHVYPGAYHSFPQESQWQHCYLNMRPQDDFRPAPEMKAEILDRILADGRYKPVMAFEDDPKVCEMWHARGLTVAQIGRYQGVAANPKDVYASQLLTPDKTVVIKNPRREDDLDGGVTARMVMAAEAAGHGPTGRAVADKIAAERDGEQDPPDIVETLWDKQ